jgi:hypothetical protein
VKPRISARVSEDLAGRLDAAANRHATSKTAIIEAALARYLDPSGGTSDNVALLRRLNWMSRQLEQLDRDLRIVSETVALHARYHLAVTPPMPVVEQPTACRLGAERFDVLAAQVGRRVHLGTPLMRETMDRLSVTSPDLFAGDREVVDARGVQSEADPESPSRSADNIDDSSDLLAAVQEDGSNRNFQRRRNASESSWRAHPRG